MLYWGFWLLWGESERGGNGGGKGVLLLWEGFVSTEMLLFYFFSPPTLQLSAWNKRGFSVKPEYKEICNAVLWHRPGKRGAALPRSRRCFSDCHCSWRGEVVTQAKQSAKTWEGPAVLCWHGEWQEWPASWKRALFPCSHLNRNLKLALNGLLHPYWFRGFPYN